jgi:hypothetical protein
MRRHVSTRLLERCRRCGADGAEDIQATFFNGQPFTAAKDEP